MLKKWLIAAGCSVAVCLAVTLWIVPQIKSSRAAAEIRVPVSSAETVSTASAASAESLSGQSSAVESRAPAYLIGEYQGNVAVFRFGETKPVQILETPLSVLPEEDRRLLQKGIPVETEEELISILEDYS